MAAAATVEDTLAWEAEQRPRAGWATVGAAAAGLVGALVFVVGTRGGPEGESPVGVVDALDAAAGGGLERLDPLTVRQVDFLGDQAPLLVPSSLLVAVGTILGLAGLVYLWRATKHRVPEFGRLALVAVVAGSVAYGVGYGVRFVTLWLKAADFDAGASTAEQARAIFTSPTVNAGTIVETLGMFGLAVGLVLLSLNAMRAGLLTRFMGILGILVGVLFVFPIDQPGVIRWFWLGALGVLILGRWPNGMPPAWASGRAEPWPSQQELAERRAAAREGREPEEPARAADEPGGGGRRKRKRRR